MNIHNNILVLIISFTLIIPSGLRSQEGDVYVSLSGGASIPLSDYAATDFDIESSGFASTGGSFTIDFGYRLNEYLSLEGLLSGGVNRFDYVALQDWFNENYTEALPDTRWLVESKSWGLGGLLVGLTGSLPLTRNKLCLDARALAGFTYVYSPALTITGFENGEDDLRLYIDQYSAISWAIDIGAGFRYKRTRKQYFTLYADYVVAHPQYNSVEIQDNDIGLSRETSFSQKIYTINITLGIGYIVN